MAQEVAGVQSAGWSGTTHRQVDRDVEDRPHQRAHEDLEEVCADDGPVDAVTLHQRRRRRRRWWLWLLGRVEVAEAVC